MSVSVVRERWCEAKEHIGLIRARLGLKLRWNVSLIDGLTKREREVLAWLHQGMSNKEIALAMAISPKTVQKHLQRIYQWFGFQTRVELLGVKLIEERAQDLVDADRRTDGR